MTAAETKDIVRLLLDLCPVKAPPITKTFAAAWVAALEPYSYSQIRSAALDHARNKPFFPRVSDLVKGAQPAATEWRDDLELAKKILAQRKQQRGVD